MFSIGECLLVGFDEEMANTRKLLECLPDDRLDFKPHPKSMSLGRLAGHVAEMPGWAVDAIRRESLSLTRAEGIAQYTPYLAASRQEALAKFDGLVVEARGLISQAGDGDLAQPWSLILNGKTVFSRPRAEVLRLWFVNHLIHHRAQLGVYLRLLDIPIPGMYGPSADTLAEMSARYR